MEAQMETKKEIIKPVRQEKQLILTMNMYQMLMKEAEPKLKYPHIFELKTDIIRQCLQPAIRELDNPEALLVKLTSRINEKSSNRSDYQYFYLQVECRHGPVCKAQYFLRLKHKPKGNEDHVCKSILVSKKYTTNTYVNITNKNKYSFKISS